MAQDIAITYKKYVVQKIINPGVYWMSKNHNSVFYKREMQQFDYLLKKNVEKIVNIEKISIGKIIAVKDGAEFHRGLVTDIFNRNSRLTYLILLIDLGNMIETTEKRIYWIKNKELINKKASAKQVSIKGIKPVALDLKQDKHLSDGIFQRRVQDNWSASAFKYVQDLFEKNPCVFVKPLHSNSCCISGEIYLIQESEKAPVSLGQKLCDNGFAVFTKTISKSFVEVDMEGDLSVEKKIPNGALITELLQHKEMVNSGSQLNKDESIRITSTQLTNTNTDNHSQQNKRCKDSEEKEISSQQNMTDNKKSNFNTSHVLSSNTCSSSLILKANLHNLSHSSYASFKKCAFPEAGETPSLILENSKVSIFGIVKRSLELYEKQKKELRCHYHN